MGDFDSGRMLARQREQRYGWMEPACPEPLVSRRYSALDVGPCESCGAGTGTMCDGGRPHPERVSAAVSALRAGELPEATAATATVYDDDVSDCFECGARRTPGGRAMACGLAHRCQKLFPTKKTCSGIREAGSRFCAAHRERPSRVTRAFRRV